MKKLLIALAAVVAVFAVTACDSAPAGDPASKKITNAPGSGTAGTQIERNKEGDK